MFSTNLKKLRESIGLSQEQLARQFGVTQQTVGKWERSVSVPRQPMLEKIANFFHVSTDYLLGRTDIPDPLPNYINPDLTQEQREKFRANVAAMTNDGKYRTPQVTPQDSPQGTPHDSPHDGEFIKGLLPIDNHSKFSAMVKKAMEFYQYYEQLPPDLKSAVDSILLSQRNNKETAETSGKKMSLSKRHAHV